MTSRPCRPKKLLTVDIPHPRAYAVVTSRRYRRYRELVQETAEAVHEEAIKAFELGEREAAEGAELRP